MLLTDLFFLFYDYFQLEVHDSDEGRIEKLDLSGEVLDSKQCEALEEIFRRLQFNRIDLESASLEEDVCLPALHNSSFFLFFYGDFLAVFRKLWHSLTCWNSMTQLEKFLWALVRTLVLVAGNPVLSWSKR